MPLHYNVIFRGSTAWWGVTFYDALGNVTQPPAASVTIVYPTPGGGTAVATVPMVPGTPWTAEWDSRVAVAGVVYWSVATVPPVPISQGDGQFILSANPANVAANGGV